MVAQRAVNQITLSDLTDAYSVTLTSYTQSLQAGANGLGSAVTLTVVPQAYVGDDMVACDVVQSEVSAPSDVTAVSVTKAAAALWPTVSITVGAGTTSDGEVTIPVHVADLEFSQVFRYSISEKGTTGATGPQGPAGTSVSITAHSVKYAASETATQPSASAFSDTRPATVAASHYLWTWTHVAYSDGTQTDAYSVVRQGAAVSSSAVSYAQSSDGANPPSTGWADWAPQAVAGSYIWTRTVDTYTDGATSTSYSVSKNGADGAKGDAGSQGPAGMAGDTPFVLVITSSQGLQFKNTAIATTLTAVVYRGASQLTASDVADMGGVVRWYRDQDLATAVHEGLTYQITSTMVTNKATFTAVLEMPEAEYDASTGRYVNLGYEMRQRSQDLTFTVRMPNFSYSSTTACEKLDANSGLVVEPSTAETAGRDDYAAYSAFYSVDVNGGADANGTPYVTAIDGDASFARDGSNGDVWVMAPVLYYRLDRQADYTDLSIRDRPADGFSPQPGAYLPDGTLRPFMLYAKYAGGMCGGRYASVSGVPTLNRTVSHNTLITLASAVGAGYSGKSVADDWYVKAMFLVKYASKSSQAVFAGCTGYTLQCSPTVAESGVRRVVVSNANAASIEVGSAMMLGSQSTSTTDRSQAACYDVFDGARVVSKSAYDGSNTGVYFDTASTFSTGTGYRLSTAPWPSGALDGVRGRDGTVTAAGRTNGREPFLLQGIECMVGVYEVLSGVILDAKESSGQLLVEVNVAYDTADDATSLTSDFTDTGVSLPTAAAAGDIWVADVADAGGLLVGVGSGASSSTGLGDASYQNVATSKGAREFLGLGDLGYGGGAGLFRVHSIYGLGHAGWYFGSRLSATGRTRG